MSLAIQGDSLYITFHHSVAMSLAIQADTRQLMDTRELKGNPAHHKSAGHFLQNLLLVESQFLPSPFLHPLLFQLLQGIHLACHLALAGMDQPKSSFPQHTIDSEMVLGDRHPVVTEHNRISLNNTPD